MLTVRRPQLQALTDSRRSAVREDVLSAALRRQSPTTPAPSDAYLAGLMDHAEHVCALHGLGLPGQLLDLVDALLKDDVHPLTDQQRMLKTERFLREQEIRDLHARLQAVRVTQAADAARSGRGVGDSKAHRDVAPRASEED